MEGLVTLLFFKIERQNLVNWGISMCIFKKLSIFKIQGFYDVIMTSYNVHFRTPCNFAILKEEAQNFVSCIILMCFPRKRH